MSQNFDNYVGEGDAYDASGTIEDQELAQLQAEIDAEEALAAQESGEDDAIIADDATIDGDDDDDDDSPESAARAARRGTSRADIKRVVTKVIQLQEASAEDLTTLGILYSVEPDPAELAVEIMVTGGAGVSIIKDIHDVRAESPFSAAASVQRHIERKGAKWGRTVLELLTAANATSTKTLSGGNAKIAATLAEAIFKAPQEALDAWDQATKTYARRTV